MLPRTLFALGLLALVAGATPAQVTLRIPVGPVSPGVPFTVVLTNNTPGCVDVARTNVLTLLQPTGELILPALVGCGPVSTCLGNGGKTSLSFTAPASGPGSSGSFVLLCPGSTGAAVRLDVAAPSGGFPDIHVYPAGIVNGPGGHHVNWPAGTATWQFANTAAVARTISPAINIYRPGAATAVRGFVHHVLPIPANGITGVPLPLTGLAGGPYTVEAVWTDPGLQRSVTVRHGLELSSGTSVDLHFPGGRTIARQASITARIAVTQASPLAPQPWPYVVAVGYQPGSTPLGGAILPLAIDPLVVASVVNGVNGLLSGHVGVTSHSGVYCAHSVAYYPTASGIRFAHPGAPLAGLRLRAAAVAIDPATRAIAASQPEEITLQ